MKRSLIIRLITLELAPMVAALVVSTYAQRLMPAALFTAGLTILVSVILSLRDGAVLGSWTFGGVVFERLADRSGFWFFLAVHSVWAAFFLLGGAVTFLWPRPI